MDRNQVVERDFVEQENEEENKADIWPGKTLPQVMELLLLFPYCLAECTIGGVLVVVVVYICCTEHTFD